MIHFIINPASCSGKSLEQWNKLKARLDCLPIKYDTYFTKSYEDTAAYTAAVTAKDRDKGGLHQLAILGGDGTVNEVINGIADRRNTCITYFPTGSGNDLARSLGIECNMEDSIKRLTSMDSVRKVDIGKLTCYSKRSKPLTRLFVISSGIGFDAASCARSLKSRLKTALGRLGLGKLIYLINALYCLFHIPPCECIIKLDDEIKIVRKKLLFCVSTIQKYEGGGFPFCPITRDNDGIYDICLVNGIHLRNTIYLIPMAAFGMHVKSRFVSRYRAKTIEIFTSVPLYVHADGEVPGAYRHIKISVPEDGTLMFR